MVEWVVPEFVESIAGSAAGEFIYHELEDLSSQISGELKDHVVEHVKHFASDILTDDEEEVGPPPAKRFKAEKKVTALRRRVAATRKRQRPKGPQKKVVKRRRAKRQPRTENLANLFAEDKTYGPSHRNDDGFESHLGPPGEKHPRHTGRGFGREDRSVVSLVQDWNGNPQAPIVPPDLKDPGPGYGEDDWNNQVPAGNPQIATEAENQITQGNWTGDIHHESGAMPYSRRKYYRKKRTYKKRMPVAKRVYRRTVPYHRPEVNSHDTEVKAKALVANANWSSTSCEPATTLCLNAMAVGTSTKERIGRHIFMKTLMIRGVIDIGAQPINTAVNTNDTLCCIMVILDSNHNATGAAALGGEIFEACTTALMAPYTYKKLDSGNRFKILAKTFVKVKPDIIWEATEGKQRIKGTTVPFQFYINLRDLKVTFDDDAGSTIASIADYTINVYANCDYITLAPTISFMSRLRFTNN